MRSGWPGPVAARSSKPAACTMGSSWDRAIRPWQRRPMATARPPYGLQDLKCDRPGTTARGRRPIFDAVSAKVGFVEGTLWHLWHGDRRHRRYGDRYSDFAGFEFDPYSDIAISGDGSWRWSTAKDDRHEHVSRYFSSRREDGDALDAAARQWQSAPPSADAASGSRQEMREMGKLAAVPVVMAVWRRVHLLERTLSRLSMQNGVRAELHMLNNNSDAQTEIEQIAARFRSRLDITIAHSNNKSSCFGRFLYMHQLRHEHPFIVVIDDDQLFDDHFLRTLCEDRIVGGIAAVHRLSFSEEKRLLAQATAARRPAGGLLRSGRDDHRQPAARVAQIAGLSQGLHDDGRYLDELRGRTPHESAHRHVWSEGRHDRSCWRYVARDPRGEDRDAGDAARRGLESLSRAAAGP